MISWNKRKAMAEFWSDTQTSNWGKYSQFEEGKINCKLIKVEFPV